MEKHEILSPDLSDALAGKKIFGHEIFIYENEPAYVGAHFNKMKELAATYRNVKFVMFHAGSARQVLGADFNPTLAKASASRWVVFTPNGTGWRLPTEEELARSRYMRIKATLIALVLFTHGLASAASSDVVIPPSTWEITPMETCEMAATSENQVRYRFGSLKELAKRPENQDGKTWVQNSLLHVFSKTMVQKRRFPTTEEITSHLKGYLPKAEQADPTKPEPPRSGRDQEAEAYALMLIADPSAVMGANGIWKNHVELVEAATKAYPEIFARLRGSIQRQAFLFFRHRLRPPTFQELGDFLRYEDLRVLQGIVYQRGFWDEALKSNLGNHLDFAKTRIVTAYARAVRGTDTPADWRTRKIHPEIRRLVEIMVMTKSNLQYRWRAFTGNAQEHQLFDKNGKLNEEALEKTMALLETQLRAMLGDAKTPSPGPALKDQWMFEMPVLFPGGIDELHATAVKEYQPTFNSFVDIEKYSIEYAEKVMEAMAKSDGIITSSVIPGVKIDWDLVDAMVKMSRETGYPIVLSSTTGSFRHVDPKLLEYPEIRFLVNGVHNNSIRFVTTPVTGQDPFAKFKKPGKFVHGQQLIVPHYTLQFAAIPTAKNHLDQTQMYTSGVINVPEIPSNTSAGQVKAEDIAQTMKRSFLVVEKSDKGTGDMGGVANQWHVRPVEFRPAAGGLPSVFVDVDQAYIVDGEGKGPDRVRHIVETPRTFFMFDLHFVVADPVILNAFRDYVRRNLPPNARIVFVLPDPLDNQNNNGHVEKKQKDIKTLQRLYATGQLNFEDELNDLNSNINVLLSEFPQAEIVFQWDNHSQEWIDKNVINDPTWLQAIANGAVSSEIKTAMSNNKEWKSPLEYLLIHRKAYLARTSLSGTDDYLKGRTFIADPARVRVMKKGEPISSADTDPAWDIAFQHHGHQGANGGRSSFKTHQMGEKRAFAGDAHREGYAGFGENMWIGVGASSFQQPYTQGGYSSWGVGFGVGTSRSTMTLLQLEPNSSSFTQRKDIGVLPPQDFFGENPLKLITAMDDDERRREYDAGNFVEWMKEKSNWISDGRLTPPPFSAETAAYPAGDDNYLED
jgi:hypothetical protein